EVRDKKPCRSAVFGGKIFSVKAEGDPRLPVPEVVQRQVSGVVTVRTHHCVRSICLHVCKHRVERHAFPGRAEFRPSRDAVQINREDLGRQIAKRLPVPSPQNIRAVVDHKFPAVERHVWCRSRGQDWEVSRTYCAGGSFTSAALRRPEKPREIILICTSPYLCELSYCAEQTKLPIKPSP